MINYRVNSSPTVNMSTNELPIELFDNNDEKSTLPKIYKAVYISNREGTLLGYGLSEEEAMIDALRQAR